MRKIILGIALLVHGIHADPWLFLVSPLAYAIDKMGNRVAHNQFEIFDDEVPPAQHRSVHTHEGNVDALVGMLPTEVEDIITFLENPEPFIRFGISMPKGVLFVGPPGTGKTSMAREIARRAGAYFISASGSEFVNKYVGVGADNVRKLFKQARDVLAQGKHDAVIVFIDELDALGASRCDSLEGGNAEYNQTVNQLLTEMDGFKQQERLLVIAATNREDVLDPALLRPGRFDRRAYFKLPSQEDRMAILVHYMQGKPIALDIDILMLAQKTVGMSGADLKNMVNEAAIEAARTQSPTISMNHCMIALEKAIQRLKIRDRVRGIHH